MNLSVGPFVIERHEGKLHFHMVPSVLGYLGKGNDGISRPFEYESNEEKTNSLYIWRSNHQYIHWYIDDWDRFWSLALPVLHLFRNYKPALGITNLSPVMAESVMTDGLVIQKLRTVPVEDSVIVTAYSVLQEGMKTPDVKRWDANLIGLLEVLVATDDPTAKSFLPTLGYYYLPAEPGKVLGIGRTSVFMREDAYRRLLCGLCRYNNCYSSIL